MYDTADDGSAANDTVFTSATGYTGATGYAGYTDTGATSIIAANSAASGMAGYRNEPWPNLCQLQEYDFLSLDDDSLLFETFEL